MLKISSSENILKSKFHVSFWNFNPLLSTKRWGEGEVPKGYDFRFLSQLFHNIRHISVKISNIRVRQYSSFRNSPQFVDDRSISVVSPFRNPPNDQILDYFRWNEVADFMILPTPGRKKLAEGVNLKRF